MLGFIKKKLAHCFVIASIIFGCSVQAATPSFKEDLDDFEEIHFIDQTAAISTQFEPLVILWQNEDLAQTLTVSNTFADDIELFNIKLGNSFSFLINPSALLFWNTEFIQATKVGLKQARAPPFFS
ncbi:hypothetical protein MCEREM21_00810 [Burkholderiaceae bacterium]